MDLQGLQMDWKAEPIKVQTAKLPEKSGKPDLRVSRTDRMIREAFLLLLTEQDFEDIRVKQIAEKAMINRKTFYAHYGSKELLYDSMVRELLTDLCGSFMYRKEEPGWELKEEDLPRDAYRFLELLETYREEVTILINPRFNIRWYPILEEVISAGREDLMLRSETQQQKGRIPFRLYLDMITSQLVIWIYWWMSQEDHSLQEGSMILSRLINRSMANVFRYVRPAKVSSRPE